MSLQAHKSKSAADRQLDSRTKAPVPINGKSFRCTARNQPIPTFSEQFETVYYMRNGHMRRNSHRRPSMHKIDPSRSTFLLFLLEELTFAEYFIFVLLFCKTGTEPKEEDCCAAGHYGQCEET